MNHEITGIILAGGKSSRFQGQNKALLKIGEKSMVEYVIENLRQQVSRILVICNRDADWYQQQGLTTLADQGSEGGPLQGIVTALNKIDTAFALFAPCDVPFFPNLAQPMFDTLSQQGKIACILKDDQRLHPAFCLLHRASRAYLKECLDNRRYKLQSCLQELDHCFYHHSAKEFDLFNVNSQVDLDKIKQYVNT